MLATAGQTVKPNWLKVFERNQGYSEVTETKKFEFFFQIRRNFFLNLHFLRTCF